MTAPEVPPAAAAPSTGVRPPFGLHWSGRAGALAAAAAPPRGTLRRDRALDLGPPDAAHALVVGDNLDALKLLRSEHAGAVRLVYIDPPYNQGTDYLYADTFRSGMAGPESRHGAWLDLMLPRLVLARDLLAPDGVLFVSIGDGELAHLRLLLDEVFGERNFVGCVPRITKRTSNQGTHFAPSKDYLLAYARELDQLPPFHDLLDPAYGQRFRGQDARGRFATVALFQNALDPRPNQRYWIRCPDGTFVIPPGETLPAEVADGAFVVPQGPADRVWRWSHASYAARRDLLVWKQTARSPLRTPDGSRARWNVYTKYYLEDRLASGRRPRDFLLDVTNDQGTAELKALGLDDCFPFAKPVGLVRRLLHWIAAPDALVLDFFAGSGTTAQAVLEQNAADGGQRRFLLVQSAAATGRADFPTIADLTVERVRRAVARLDAASPARPGEDRGCRRFSVVEPTAHACQP